MFRNTLKRFNSLVPVVSRFLRIAVLLPILTLTVADTSVAQELSDPESRFYDELESGRSLDEAAEIVAREFGPAVAIEIAVYLCSPQPDDDCEGSVVWETWADFFSHIYDENQSVDYAVEEMTTEEDWDAFLVTGIAVYWCSPDAGQGCEDSRFTQAWSEFGDLIENGTTADVAIAQLSATAGGAVAQLIAAGVCGESTCYADETSRPAQPVRTQPPQAKRWSIGAVASFADKPKCTDRARCPS